MLGTLRPTDNWLFSTRDTSEASKILHLPASFLLLSTVTADLKSPRATDETPGRLHSESSSSSDILRCWHERVDCTSLGGDQSQHPSNATPGSFLATYSAHEMTLACPAPSELAVLLWKEETKANIRAWLQLRPHVPRVARDGELAETSVHLGHRSIPH